MPHPDPCPVCGGEQRKPIYDMNGEFYCSVPCPSPRCTSMPVVGPFASLSAGDADIARAAGPARRSLGVGGCGND